MNAKEMFEKLGYVIEKEDDDVIAYERDRVFVVFRRDVKTYFSFELYRDYKLIVNNTISTHLAIHQQMKELGWIE